MIRLLRTACTANLLLALSVAGGYIIWGLANGLGLDQHCLGFQRGHLGRGGGPMVPARVGPAIVESAILLTFILGHCARWKMKTYRVFCAVFGLLALFGLFLPLLQIMPPISAEGDVLPRPGIATVLTRDSWFALYIWSSHLLYGALGQPPELAPLTL